MFRRAQRIPVMQHTLLDGAGKFPRLSEQDACPHFETFRKHGHVRVADAGPHKTLDGDKHPDRREHPAKETQFHVGSSQAFDLTRPRGDQERLLPACFEQIFTARGREEFGIKRRCKRDLTDGAHTQTRDDLLQRHVGRL